MEVSSDLMVAALAATPTMAAAARLLDCSAPLIHYRAESAGERDVAQAVAEQKQTLEDRLAESILRHRGVLSKVADDVGLGSGQAVRYHITRSATLQQVFSDARVRVIDRAEENVFAAVEQGDLTYSWKVLQTLGKDRGYTERRELDAIVTHTLDAASTGSLVQLLDRLAATYPEAVEAEFSELSDEDRAELSELVEERAL